MTGAGRQRMVLGQSLRMTRIMQRAISFLELGNADLAGLLVEEAAGNPHLAVTLPEPIQTGPRPGLRAEREPWRWRALGSGDAVERIEAAADGLYAHVERQIGLLFRTPREVAIAQGFAEALEPTGWLGSSVEDIARRVGCTPGEAGAVLARLQMMEPAGLFSRSLSECLALQLADAGRLDDPMRRLLENLPALARGDTATLMRVCGVDAATLGAMVRQVRSLDPKPGTHFDCAPELRRAPDLIVTRDGAGGWQIELNTASAPLIRVEPGDAGESAALARARWFDRTVSHRNRLVLQVASQVVAIQHDFVEGGAACLKPLTAAAVAERLGLHETTVGRIRRGLLVQTPGRVLPLRAFFGRGGAERTGGGRLPGTAISALIAEIVAAEPGDRPLTDAALAEALTARGLQVSRRTITNLRRKAGLPGAACRKGGR